MKWKTNLIQMDDVGADVVEEGLVVRDDEQSLLPVLQVIVQPEMFNKIWNCLAGNIWQKKILSSKIEKNIRSKPIFRWLFVFHVS